MTDIELETPIARERTPRLLSVLFLSAVALLLVLPLAQTVTSVFPALVPPLEERRQPAPFPSPRLLLGANGDFASGLNAWFDDQVGFRNVFIRAKNQIDYSLFRTSRKVYVGSDGWLFDRIESDPLMHLNAQRMAELEASFVTLARRLREKGIRLIVVGYVDKSRIYPELAPPQLPPKSADDRYDALRRFLSARGDLTFIDTEDLFNNEKTHTKDRLYAKTDMHPTALGQVPVVKEIIAQIARLEGRPDISWAEQFTLAHSRWGPGGQARYLSTLVDTTEEDYPYFANRYAIGAADPEGTWFPADPHLLDRADDGVGRPFDWEFRSRPELCPQRLPTTMLFGNSFSDELWVVGLHRYFCQIRRVRDPIARFQLFYDTMPNDTKYFIFQFILQWLPGDAPPLK